MRFIASLFLISLCAVSVADDAYWNQFRGPRGDGISDAKGLPVQFAEGSPEIVWKTPVAGRAWSSPVVWGNQVWMTNAPELHKPADVMHKLEQPIPLSAVCLDLTTGKVLHDIKVFDVEVVQITHVTNSYASPTPCIEAGRVYLHFGSYGTACLDTATGKKLWERRDLECDHFRGAGSSPVVYGDLLYLCFDGYDKQYIVALNKKTGETIWKKDRDIDYGTDNGDAKKAYGTPQLIKVDGRELLVSPFAAATIAYDPKTGERIWMVKHGGMNAAARPLYGNGLVYINAGDASNALVAVKPNGTGDITSDIVWKTSKQTPKRSSQILLGDLFFMMNDGGVATCLDAKDGKVIWTERLEGAYWSSPIYADGLIYCFSQEGHVLVFKADRTFEMVAKNKLDDGSNASPAVAGNSLIVRSKSHVYRIAKKN